jgi:4-alpha-glucanotransferase
MWVHFFIRFHTRPGQSLWLTGDTEALGSGGMNTKLPMRYHNDEMWELAVDIPDGEWSDKEAIVYSYVLEDADGSSIEEWGRDRRLLKSDVGNKGRLEVLDTWNHAGSYENVFFNSAFSKVLLPARKKDRRKDSSSRFTHVFRVKAPLLSPEQEICLTGSAAPLGGWQRSEAVPMRRRNGWWELRLDLGREEYPFTYKYAVRNTDGGDGFFHYEEGQNRVLHAGGSKRSNVILHDGFARLANDSWRGTGIAIPVFSLRSDHGYGVGEFGDIRLLVDWAVKTGLRMIQILPVNDTISSGTWKDSYPYSAISAFALHPMYLDVRQLAGESLKGRLSGYEEERRLLNDEPQVDYERVVDLKMRIIKELYPLVRNKTFASKAYASFFESNRHWLLPYAVFCCLRDRFGTADFTKWADPYGSYETEWVEKAASEKGECRESVLLHCFIQYHLHVQLSMAHDYANGKGIILKGDIPIGVNRHGVEAWMEPELFRLEMQAGAPPDDFAVKGQNWGFPTYDWARMQKDGFHWWKLRFEQMSRYFDAFRIDHILGFFRIWSIPHHAIEGIMGRFVPAIPVRSREFHERGIPFSVDRLCRPFITDGVLWELFGSDHVLFKPYLQETEPGVYILLPEYDTQRKVRERFRCPNDEEQCRKIMTGLFDLVSNVILFQEEGSDGEAFHFRFGMESTSSFRHLDDHVKQGLKDLYVDYFYRRQDDFWKKEAMKRLPALKRSTEMLVCGEDLGMVPGCVPDVMSQLGILSMEVQRMPKNPEREFFHPNDAPYLSVVTPSSHDMSTVREWWSEDRSATQRFFTHELGQYSAAPSECLPWISRAILRQHLLSPAQWAVFQFQDLVGIDGELRLEDYRSERINIPSVPEHYWRYRMHLSLERLMGEESFTNALREDINASGRLHV